MPRPPTPRPWARRSERMGFKDVTPSAKTCFPAAAARRDRLPSSNAGRLVRPALRACIKRGRRRAYTTPTAWHALNLAWNIQARQARAGWTFLIRASGSLIYQVDSWPGQEQSAQPGDIGWLVSLQMWTSCRCRTSTPRTCSSPRYGLTYVLRPPPTLAVHRDTVAVGQPATVPVPFHGYFILIRPGRALRQT